MERKKIEAERAQTADGTFVQPQPEKPANLPEHLIGLAPNSWALWRWVGLRGAGFPLAEALKLAEPECAAVADSVIRAEDEAERLWQSALQTLVEDYKNCQADSRPAISKALKRLKKARVPDSLPAGCNAQEAVKQFAAACEAVDQAYADYNEKFTQAIASTSRVILNIARGDEFREAVLWQNRTAYRTAIDQLLKRPTDAKRDSKHRQHEELVASYWQRYCTKNDSVGFFGPVGWAQLVPEARAIDIRTGSHLVATRTVYFERWCIDAIADLLNKDESARPFMPPRRIPTTYLLNDSLFIPAKGFVPLTPSEAAIINACDGKRSAKEIAEEMVKAASLGFGSEGDVFQEIENLARKSFLTWSVMVPPSCRPDESFRQLVERIGDADVSARALAALDELEAARQKIALAAGNVAELDFALGELDATFTRLTGLASTRSDGKMYAGRTLVYEDCRRDGEVRIGNEILAELGPALALLLTSARWLTFKVAQAYRTLFQEIYTELVRETGAKVIDSFSFWARVKSRLSDSKTGMENALREMFQQLWAELLSLPEDGQAVTYTSEMLKARVQAAFDAPHPGWQYARYHSPDVMIAATSADAIREKDYQFVLGELHLATNTLSLGLFVNQHPSPEDLFQALEIDLPQPRITPVFSKAIASARNILMLLSPKDYHLELTMDTASPLDVKTLLIGSLVIEDTGNGAIVRTRDGELQFDIIEAFSFELTDKVVNLFKILPPREHTPRVTIDRLVVSRETWRMKAAEMSFAFEKDDAMRFLNARRWAAELGLPRFVFYKSPIEDKPVFLDFQSPVLVNLLARVVRRTVQGSGADETIWVSEMLPGPDEVWLEDGAGQRYTSELRLVAVDQRDNQKGR
jgi:hypothetical protein